MLKHITHDAYYSSLEAERRWVAALVLTYGPASYPDSRYDRRAVATKRLRGLYTQWRQEVRRWLARA